MLVGSNSVGAQMCSGGGHCDVFSHVLTYALPFELAHGCRLARILALHDSCRFFPLLWLGLALRNMAVDQNPVTVVDH